MAIRTRHLVSAGISGSVAGGLDAERTASLVRPRSPGRRASSTTPQAEKAKKAGPNDQIVMAAIGVGGQGTGIMKSAKKKPGRQVRRRLRHRRRATPRKRPRKSARTARNTRISASS